MIGGDDSAFEKVLASPPEAIEDEAAVAREAGTGADVTREEEAAFATILNWTELHCRDVAPGDSARHLAPALDAEIDGITFCSTMGFPSAPADGRSGAVLYGDASAMDPYDGPMIGIFWSAGDEVNHAGDGESVPVTVRGQAGVAAPITVFQQTIIPELGTVIAWTEGGRAFGLYGRLWSMDEKDELIALADAIEESDERYALPEESLPSGFAEVFSGDPGVMSLVVPASASYDLHYSGDDGVLNLSGHQMTEEEFNAFRFLTVGIERSEIGGRQVLSGNAWSTEGPGVVTWREPDGLVVRIVGLGVSLDSATAVAEATRELTEDEWAMLVEAEDGCEDLVP